MRTSTIQKVASLNLHCRTDLLRHAAFPSQRVSSENDESKNGGEYHSQTRLGELDGALSVIQQRGSDTTACLYYVTSYL
jgi:hypothetical protein